jgi:hypothetical protein
MYSKEDKNQPELKKSVKLIQKFNFNENIVSSVCDLCGKSVGSKEQNKSLL